MTTTIPDLQTALLELLYEIRDSEIKLIIGGGYGIYLKAIHAMQGNASTLMTEKPEPRSTNDLDLFLRPELLISPEKLKPLREALDRLGYKVIKGAENYQFVRGGTKGAETAQIKIDLLTGPASAFDNTGVKVVSRRAKPNPSVGIHAHRTDEAPTLEEDLLPIQLTRHDTSGEQWTAEVFLPHPYTFATMKLFAFRDQYEGSKKDFGRYHALDLYMVLATTTEKEWEEALEIRDQQAGKPISKEAGHLVTKYFSDMEQGGIIRLRESHYFRPEFQLVDFMSILKELFPDGTKVG